MNIPIKIELPQIWSGSFEKNEWNSINFIVGPNGTGKTLLSNQLYDKLKVKAIRFDYYPQNACLDSKKRIMTFIPVVS